MGIIVQNITKLVLAPIFKQYIFLKSYVKNVNVFMFFNFVPNFYFYWKIPLGKWFFKFWSHDFFAKQKFVYWPPFWNETFLDHSFCWYMVILGVYTHGASFVPKLPWESTQKWMGPSGTSSPCSQMGWKVPYALKC